MLEVILYILAAGYATFVIGVMPIWWMLEDHAPEGKEPFYMILIVLWPITLILLSPILLVIAVKYIAIATSWAGRNTVKAFGEIAPIYKAVIKR